MVLHSSMNKISKSELSLELLLRPKKVNLIVAIMQSLRFREHGEAWLWGFVKAKTDGSQCKILPWACEQVWLWNLSQRPSVSCSPFEA